jgi:molybdopterin/thiamine biosynthesis adenylyltransferase
MVEDLQNTVEEIAVLVDCTDSLENLEDSEENSEEN